MNNSDSIEVIKELNPQENGEQSGESFITYKVNENHFTVPSRYVIEGYIGRGNSEHLVSGIDRKLNRPIVIRKFHTEVLKDYFLKKMYREFRILQELGHHENLIKIYDAFTHREEDKDGNVLQIIYIVYNRIQYDLRKILKSGQGVKQLTEENVQYMFYQILLATRHIHSANLAHLDIKPSNILISPEWDVVLRDLEYCRVNQSDISPRDEELDDDYSRDRRFYRSPEKLCQYEKYCQKSDIWSIGCILGELIFQKPLFDDAYLGHVKLTIDFSSTEPCVEDGVFKGSKKAKEFVVYHLEERKSKQINSEEQDKKFISGFEKLKNDTENHSFEVSENAWDLLKKLLVFNPDERISVNDALRHPFFAKMHDHEDFEEEESGSKHIITQISPWEENKDLSPEEGFLKDIEIFHKLQNEPTDDVDEINVDDK